MPVPTALAPPLILPWPDPRLSPNARVHWSAKARAAATARKTAFALARAYGYPAAPLPELLTDPQASLHLHLHFYPPDRRRRDDDNLLCTFKAYRDGLADALQIDDKRFISHPRLCAYDAARRASVEVRLSLKAPFPVLGLAT